MRHSSWFGIVFAAVTAMGQQRNFVACPIVRDTKTVPCFLAEYQGELYFLGAPQDGSEFHPPQLKHEVLVEGRVASGPRICGGIPLQPVAVSVLKEVNLACNTLLPSEPGLDAPPVPRGVRAEAGTAKLVGPHEFSLLYPFNDDNLPSGSDRLVTEAAAYANRIGASKVTVAGYRATTLLSNGERLVEKPGLSEKRAQNIATLLRGLGVSGVAVEWKNEPESGDGSSDPAHRRVTILVAP